MTKRKDAPPPATVPRYNGKHPGGRPPIHGTPDTMQPLIDKYFADCDACTQAYTVTGLALALGFCDRASLYDYRDKEEFFHSVRSALTRVESFAERLLMSGGNAAGAIFALKNHGWRDDTGVRHSGEISISQVQRDAAVAAAMAIKDDD